MNNLSQALLASLVSSVLTAALIVAEETVSIVGVLLAVGIGACAGLFFFLPYLNRLEQIRLHIRSLLLEAEQESGHSSEETSSSTSHPTHALTALRYVWQRRVNDAEEKVASFEAVLDILPDPLLILSARRRVLRANKAALHVLGDAVQGQDLAGCLRAPAVLDAFERIRQNSNTSCEVPISLPNQSGGNPPFFDFLVRLAPLSTYSLSEAVATVSLHDVTTVRRLDRMRADFIANASHELRTPLTSLLGFTETLMGPAREDTAAWDAFLPLMLDQGQRMQRLVDELLSLSRIEAEEHIPPAENVNLGDVLKSVVNSLTLMAAEKTVSFEWEVTSTFPTIPGIAAELDQVFRNLLENALKYGAAATSVHIAVKVTSVVPNDAPLSLKTGAVMITIKDHGEGISPEHLPRLTERFFRVDTARSRQLGGTGLGLAIVKHILNRHRGMLTISSTVGQGSVFSVYLPLQPEF